MAYSGSCVSHRVGSCQYKTFSSHIKGEKRQFNLKPFEWPCPGNTSLGYPKFHAPRGKQFHGFTEQRMPLVKAILKCIGGYSIGHVLWRGDILKVSFIYCHKLFSPPQTDARNDCFWMVKPAQSRAFSEPAARQSLHSTEIPQEFFTHNQARHSFFLTIFLPGSSPCSMDSYIIAIFSQTKCAGDWLVTLKSTLRKRGLQITLSFPLEFSVISQLYLK